MKVLEGTDKEIILSSIRDVPDFPKPGIMFKDITTLLNNKTAYSKLMEHLAAKYEDYNLDYIAGIESRGFIFGSALANALGIGFVPIRKPGKLPSKVVSEKYTLEYGTDEVMMNEIAAIKKAIQPQEILFVVDAMTGQDAVNTAKEFNDRLDFDGVVLTKLDGDTRGGAALSIRSVVTKPIKFVGTGEKMYALDVFYPERMADRAKPYT
jgi:adenine phosphoribosyltransferase